MNKNLIVFIDAFPYKSLKHAKYLSSFSHKAKVIPGIGYSINVKAEIFGDYTPDDAGFFCEWMYDPNAPLRKYQSIFSLIHNFSRLNYYGDRILHKVISKLLGENIFNIPFNCLGYFKISGNCAYEDNFHLPTIFSENSFKKVLYSRYPSTGNRDQQVFSEAKKVVNEDVYTNIFVALADLDYLTHMVGVGSPEHTKKIKQLDEELGSLCTQFLEKNPDANLIILSDHGMANVKGSVKVDLESHFGEPSEESYIQFIDSTMLRVWTFKKSLGEDIEEYLSSFSHGMILTPEERKKFGVFSRKFGDIIFLLNEGLVFRPSYFGRKLPRAMHGYHPKLESQEGMTTSNCISEKNVNTRELYNILSSLCTFSESTV